MAKIPTLNDNAQISTQVQRDPTLSPSEASAGSRAAAQASGQIANALGRLHQQQVREARKVDYTKAKLGFSEQADQNMRDLDKEFDGSNYEGYAAAGVKRLERIKEETLKNAPDSIKETLGLELQSNIVRQKSRLADMEANNKSKYAVRETQAMMQSAANGSYADWNPEQNFKNSQSIRNLIGSSSFYDDETKAVLNSKIKNISNDMLNGVIDRGDRGEMSKALRDLNSPELDPLFSDMDPQSKTKAIARLERKIEDKRREDMSKTKSQYRKGINALSQGELDPRNPEDRKILENLKNEITVNLEPEEAKDALAQINTYEMANKIANEGATDIFSMDPDQLANEIPVEGMDKLSAASAKADAKQVLGQIQSARIREFNKAPADYLVKYDQSIRAQSIEMLAQDSGPAEFQEYMTSMDAAYDKMGVNASDRQYLPTNVKSFYGDRAKKFLSEGDPRSASIMLNELNEKSGGDMYRFYDELDLPQNYAAVFEASDPVDREEMLMNISNYEEVIKPKFSAIEGSEKDKEIMQKLRNSDMYKGMMSIDGGRNPLAERNAESLTKVAMIEYKVARLGGSTPEEAEEQAWSKMRKSYDFVENGSNPIMVRSGKYDSGKIQNFVDNNSNMEMDYVNKFRLDVPDGYRMDEMNESLKDGGFWSYNKKSDSLRLLYLNPKTNRVQTATKDGKPFMVSLEEINTMKGEESKTRKEAIRNIFNSGLMRSNYVPSGTEKQGEAPQGMSFKVEGYMRR